MIEASGVWLPLDAGLQGNERLVASAAANALGVKTGDIREVELLRRSVDALVDGVYGSVLRDGLIRHLRNDLLQKRGDVLKMIIEGIAVDAAVLDDLFDGDLVHRFFVQKFPEGLLDGVFGE